MSANPLDAGTAAFYNVYATQLEASEASRSAMLPFFEATLAPGARVLDVGAGSGRDMAALLELGFDAFGVEPNAAMRATALRLRPNLAGRLADAALPDLGRPFSEQRPDGFDAVGCSAVLMHIGPAELPRALNSLVQQLRLPVAGEPERSRPALLLALPEMAAARLGGDRDSDGRRFHNHPPTTVQALLAASGLTLERSSINDTVLASSGTRWHMVVYRRA